MKNTFQVPQLSLGEWIKGRHYGRLWQKALEESCEYPAERFQGRGLVFCVGGEVLFVNLWINLCLLRRVLKCTLPIEVWYFGDEELTPEMRALLEPFDVRIVDGESFARDLPRGWDRGFALKTLAVINSSFEEVLFIDADNFAVRDPSFLFDELSYRWTGACFWPDVWDVNAEGMSWSVLGIPAREESEWETGQMVIHKRRTWRALSLVRHLTFHFPFYYRHGHGDKTLFYAAWKKLDQPFAMTRRAAKAKVATNAGTMLHQFDFQGELLFQHMTTSEWTLSGEEERPPLVHQKHCEEFLAELRRKWPAGAGRSRPNQKGKRSFLSIGEMIRAVLPMKSSELIQAPASFSMEERWDALAYQALASPYLVSPQWMGVGIEALQHATGDEAHAIIRFFGALIFVDPRLADMLPTNPDVEGTTLAEPWNELRMLAVATAARPDKTGFLSVHGNFLLAGVPPCLDPEELDRVRLLNALLGRGPSNVWKVWREFWRGLTGPSDTTGLTWEGESTDSSRSSIRPWQPRARRDKVLILTPLKNASDLAESYCLRLSRLNYPPGLLSLGLLESDSHERTFEVFDAAVEPLRKSWGRVSLWKHDYNYCIPQGMSRWRTEIQFERRKTLARSRNELLRRALRDEDWVLWLDADVIDYPRDIIEQLLSYGKEILHPHCVLDYGGMTFDRNAWRDRGLTHMEKLRGIELLAPLDAVGGTMIFIRADLHRRGLIFPETPYGIGHPKARESDAAWNPAEPGELETEGLGIMAHDMNVQCWGLPDLEILHRKK